MTHHQCDTDPHSEMYHNPTDITSRNIYDNYTSNGGAKVRYLVLYYSTCDYTPDNSQDYLCFVSYTEARICQSKIINFSANIPTLCSRLRFYSMSSLAVIIVGPKRLKIVKYIVTHWFVMKYWANPQRVPRPVKIVTVLQSMKIRNPILSKTFSPVIATYTQY